MAPLTVQGPGLQALWPAAGLALSGRRG